MQKSPGIFVSLLIVLILVLNVCKFLCKFVIDCFSSVLTRSNCAKAAMLEATFNVVKVAGF